MSIFDLTRISDLTLEKAEEMCRASELTNHSISTLDSSTEKVVHKVGFDKRARGNDKQGTRPKTHRPRVEKSCKLCGRIHEHRKEKCPAYGQQCRKCKQMNHFEVKCTGQVYKQQQTKYKARVHKEEEQTEYNDDDFELYTVTEQKSEYTVQTVHSSKSLLARLDIGHKHIVFHLDSGAQCNIISEDIVPLNTKLTQTTSILRMFNKTTVVPKGKCVLEVCNPKNGSKFNTEFFVVKEKCTPLLGSATMQKMELVKVRYENILTVGELGNAPATLSLEEIPTIYADVFEGNGRLEGQYHLITDDTVPPVVHPPRKVPIALRDRLKSELDRLEKLEVLTPVTTPTPWVSSMVMVVKPNKLRICIDPKDLNKAVKRSHYPLPTIEDILPKLYRAKIFSVLDARNRFWHIESDEESSLLTTFNTPFGRYRWLSMPFGISTAPEEFQRRQDQAVEGLAGVHSIVDDILVYGEGDTEQDAIEDHDRKLVALLERCRERGLKLNRDKLRLRKKEVRFIGHLITADGLKPDPEKVKAVLEMPDPRDVAGIRRFIGIINYLSKCIPGLSDKCEPVRKMTVQNVEWCWLDNHSKTVQEIKELVTSTPLLKYYDPKEELTLQCDASEKGHNAKRSTSGIRQSRAHRRRNAVCPDRKRTPRGGIRYGAVLPIHIWENGDRAK